jgi:CcmD family protein
MENMVFLFAAYTIIWIVVFGYVFYLHRKESKLWRTINLLKEHIDKGVQR